MPPTMQDCFSVSIPAKYNQGRDEILSGVYCTSFNYIPATFKFLVPDLEVTWVYDYLVT